MGRGWRWAATSLLGVLPAPEGKVHTRSFSLTPWYQEFTGCGHGNNRTCQNQQEWGEGRVWWVWWVSCGGTLCRVLSWVRNIYCGHLTWWLLTDRPFRRVKLSEMVTHVLTHGVHVVAQYCPHTCAAELEVCQVWRKADLSCLLCVAPTGMLDVSLTFSDLSASFLLFAV